jgi:hypothetical protein
MRRTLLCAALAASISLSLGAATPAAPFARLVWAEDEGALTITGPDRRAIPATIGAAIPAGSTIATGSSGAELELVPNGSAVKLAPATSFRLDALAQTGGSAGNEFTLLAGKLRMVAVKSAAPAAYAVRTPSAVCAVRGTDFARQYDPGLKKDWLCVLEGKIELTPAGGRSLLVQGGDFTSAGKGWAVEKAPQSWIDANLGDLMAFRGARP